MLWRRVTSRWRRIATPVALALISLAAALVLWIAVTDAKNPTTEVTFGGSIEVQGVNVPDGLAVASIREPSVSVRVLGPEDDLKKLTAADFRAEVNLAGVLSTTSDQRVVGRVVTKKEVEVVSVTPAIVAVVMEPIATKMVPVQTSYHGTTPQGYSLSERDTEITPGQARITGATSLVALVSAAIADVNLTGRQVTTRQQYPLIPRDVRGADIRGVRVEPTSADVRVPILQQDITLALSILPSVIGSPADGYNLFGITADPPVIAVSGSLLQLQSISAISTEPIDVSGLRADATRTARLQIPAGLQSIRDNVTVRIRVVPAAGEITTAVAPQVIGVPEGLRANVETISVSLRLAGDIPTLRSLQAGANLRVVANVGGLGEGRQVVPASVVVPDNVRVLSFEPRQIVVNLQR